MKIKIIEKHPESIPSNLLLFPVAESTDQKNCSAPLERLAAGISETREWKPAKGTYTVLIRPRECRAERVGLIGIGPDDQEFDPGAFRSAVMNAVRALRSASVQKLAADLSRIPDQEEGLRMVVEGIYLGLFDPGTHKSSQDRTQIPKELHLVSSLVPEIAERAVRESAVLAESVNLSRKLSNEPGNLLYPASFAELIKDVSSQNGLTVKIMDEEELKEEGFRCLLAVGQGSRQKPCLAILEHAPSASREATPLVLVGKGVTFDSGGISIKPSLAMEEMRADKSGACSVLGAMLAIARLGLKIRVVGLMPLVENLPGGNAQRPGDVVTAWNGKTVEIINTDAEGRLILADTLAWAVNRFKPRCLVDIATLTGACVVALGHTRAGLFSNNDQLCADLLKASKRGGEKLWRLPLDEEYSEGLESKIADLKNCGDRWGGAITAAKFLEAFIDEIPWGHIDMAGTDFFQSGPNKGTPPGFGVRTLVELARIIESK